MEWNEYGQATVMGTRRKAVITREKCLGKTRWWVAFFTHHDQNKAEQVVEFKKLKDAQYSAECHVI